MTALYCENNLFTISAVPYNLTDIKVDLSFVKDVNSALRDREFAHIVDEKLEETILFHRLLVGLLQEPIHALSEVHGDRLVSHVVVLENDEQVAYEPLADGWITSDDDWQSFRAPPLACVPV